MTKKKNERIERHNNETHTHTISTAVTKLKQRNSNTTNLHKRRRTTARRRLYMWFMCAHNFVVVQCKEEEKKSNKTGSWRSNIERQCWNQKKTQRMSGANTENKIVIDRNQKRKLCSQNFSVFFIFVSLLLICVCAVDGRVRASVQIL